MIGLNVGDVIGEFRLSFRLGEGPKGVVWRAARTDRAQNAILKLVKPTAFELGRPMRKAFDRLAHALTKYGRLEHPNLVSVVGTARRPQDGLFGLGTEYLEARNLDVYPLRSSSGRSIVDDPPAFANLLDVIEQVSTVLMWLHMNGAQHGNVKPSNVLVLPTDRGVQVKLTDFIWTRAGLGGFTEYQRVFVPPELAAGQAPTPATDQWAVAKLLHQLVVKGSPGKSQTEALTVLPVELLKIIQRSLDSNPANRFPSMAALVDAVKQMRAKQEARFEDPSRLRAHQIGYSPTTPVDANQVHQALMEERAEGASSEPGPSEDVTAKLQGVPPGAVRNGQDPSGSFGSISPSSDSNTPSGPLRPVRNAETTDIVPTSEEPARSNTLAWVVIVVASIFILVAGGVLIFGLSDGPPTVVAQPSPVTPAPKAPPSAPSKPVDEPKPQPPKEVAEPPPQEPAAGSRGVAVAKECSAGKSAACLKAGDMFLSGDGVDKSETEALALFDRACKLRSMTGCVRAGDVMISLGRAREARRLYEKACDATNGVACGKLADMWRRGEGGSQNDRTADGFDFRACNLGVKTRCK